MKGPKRLLRTELSRSVQGGPTALRGAGTSPSLEHRGIPRIVQEGTSFEAHLGGTLADYGPRHVGVHPVESVYPARKDTR